jgi:hypothetical protein
MWRRKWEEGSNFSYIIRIRHQVPQRQSDSKLDVRYTSVDEERLV